MPILPPKMPILSLCLPISEKLAKETAKWCRFCILQDAEMPKALPIMPVLAYTMCQDTLSEPASVQIHLFFKFNIVSWLNFCLCAYSHRFFRNNSVIQIYAWWLGTLLLAWVSLKYHLCSSSISASTSVDLCRDTSDITQICSDTSDTTQKMSGYLRKSWKCRYI